MERKFGRTLERRRLIGVTNHVQEVLCLVYKKGYKLDCKNYRGICLLNVTYKVFAKIIYDRLLLHANAAVQHYQAGFLSGKSTTDQLFALRQILEKCNEFNITTHYLFIDFKAAYDTIIRNEVYFGMSDLNFPTKLIRLTKAMLTTVRCCVKIQNECSESFETRQGLRQGDVLSTLLFIVKTLISPNALNVTKTSRLRHAGHMIRRPEDLPQTALFRAKPIGRRNQGRPKSRWADGVNSDSLALGVRDWTHCA
jgi:hypothetical protein